MDETTVKVLRLHQRTMFNSPTSALCNCTHGHSPSFYRRFFKWTVFPTVHASEAVAVAKPMLEIKKPKLFITDQEIQDRIVLETGMDRVKAIFQKE